MGTPDKINWEDLLAAYLSCRPGADTELVEAATPAISKSVRAFLTGADADDATQDAIVDVLRKAHTVREPSAFLGWIHVVARNAALRVCRQRARAMLPVESAVLDRHVDTESIDTGAIDARIDATGALSLLSQLTPRERQLMLLLISDGEPSYGDISCQLGCAVGSIGPTRQRAVRKLRRQDRVLAAFS
jgi:RNA polymerase sigma factor (sigma-70 family)